MLPATFVDVNAGTELDDVRSPGEVLSPPLAVSLVPPGLRWVVGKARGTGGGSKG